MGYKCAFDGCNLRAIRYEKVWPGPVDFTVSHEAVNVEVRAFCENHFGEDECPGHVATRENPKVCSRCGIHVDSLRP